MRQEFEHVHLDLEEAPEWFLNLLGQASSVGSEHHDVLEGVLGVSRLLLTDPVSAFEQARQIIFTISNYQKNPTLASEKYSTQLQAMIASGIYPPEVCERVTQLMGDDVSLTV
jgi:hypothetical protein